ncbi:hypothetical protein BDU57DRAFT_534468 [Ampelomyces quisqualis]|uniref:Uncharacterized protein n=1 Tax=Ampelomyces quisqualis TaxID=50730 RepID=A0A6A5R1P9_AMPQU|nr:hypothetical protein BDU57DRAFT_534468 [Ampelomyces quisqualis]
MEPPPGLHNVDIDIIQIEGNFPAGLFVSLQTTNNRKLVRLHLSKMSYYTGLNIAPRRRTLSDSRPRRPVALLAHHQNTDPDIESDSDVAGSKGHSTTDVPPPIPDRDVRRVVSQRTQAPSKDLCDRDMLPSQRRRQGDMSISFYDTLLQGSGERAWLRAMQKIDARRTEQACSGLSSTTSADLAIAPARKISAESLSMAFTQTDSETGAAQQAEKKSVGGAPKTFEEVLWGTDKVPTALQR